MVRKREYACVTLFMWSLERPPKWGVFPSYFRRDMAVSCGNIGFIEYSMVATRSGGHVEDIRKLIIACASWGSTRTRCLRNYDTSKMHSIYMLAALCYANESMEA